MRECFRERNMREREREKGVYLKAREKRLLGLGGGEEVCGRRRKRKKKRKEKKRFD